MKNTKSNSFCRVLYAQAVYDQKEIKAVQSVLENPSMMLMDHDKVAEFEQKISKIFGKKFGLMVNSGTAANTLALASLQFEAGTEIITPVLTFSTTVAPMVQQNLVPVFVDAESDTYNIDANQIEKMISPKTKAIMIPNLIGNLPDWSLIRSIADQHGLKVIEDSADTLGSLYQGKTTGVISDIATTSFYGSHVITCAGFGGMLCTNDKELINYAKLFRGWGRRSSLLESSENIEDRFLSSEIDGMPYDSKFLFDTIGYNFLPSEISAAFGLEQLKKLNEFIDRRQQNFKNLRTFFSSYEDWFILPRQQENTYTAWLAFPLTLTDKAPFTRKDFQVFFETRGIQTRAVFTGNILRQPAFRNISHRTNQEGYPNADKVTAGGILLGCHQGMNQKQLDYIKGTFEKFAKTY